ncbi:hypothetical protein K0018_01200 [Staphylococcus massiliensis]|uniref:hypothetical protein n=1 Tax=Staphylococcus massiliensis TaxID=555791 RepID=UPI001EDF5D5C|nr:hypothetical protein [Staphylococcus massiliensis]MCG3402321.1 hypothetical protein [Staphylococcus massiliensis]MCG3411711.1 hypothetical protein [Staphylococcus massiliensis]
MKHACFKVLFLCLEAVLEAAALQDSIWVGDKELEGFDFKFQIEHLKRGLEAIGGFKISFEHLKKELEALCFKLPI